MKLNSKLEKELIQTNKREQLIDSEFGIIKATGEMSGNIKNILYLEDLEERKRCMQYVENNLGDLFVNMVRISDALKIDFDKIIQEKIEKQ